MNRHAVWESIDLHPHPAEHYEGDHWGKICMSDAGVYRFRAGNVWYSCPQDWAARIHAGEQNTRGKIKEAITLLEKTRSAFKSPDVQSAREILESVLGDI